tara:strand:- start:12165 stop:12941 length:777 start_codon:yes stop_codon:yes gene_type:complete
MKAQQNFREMGCSECAGGAGLDFDFSMSFQPIVDLQNKKIFAYEALVRGLNNEPASKVFGNVNEGNCYRFDQACRVKAVKLASELGMDTFLSINFMPNAVYRPELCIRTTLEAADLYQFPVERIIFEFTEGERMDDLNHIREIVEYYKLSGFSTAIDDFGAGYAGLNMLAEIRTNFIKLDMALLRGIDQDPVRQIIVKGVLEMCQALGATVVAEGIESPEELRVLASFGINLFQGYYFAQPAFEALPQVQPSAYLLQA